MVKRIWQDARWLYGTTVIATLLMFLRQCQLDELLNSDGVTYLQAAAGFLQHGWHGAVALKAQAKWPFYSILIACITYLGISVSQAAMVLNGVFVMATALVFVRLVRALGGDRATQWLGLIAILAWHNFVKYWPDVLRDHGFNLFLLLSLWSFKCYLEQQKWRYALLWVVTILIAFLFRLEAIIYLIFVPLTMFFSRQHTWRDKCCAFIRLSAVPLMLLAIGMLVYVNYQLHFNDLRVDYILQQLFHAFATIYQKWQAKSLAMASQIFPNSASFAGWGLMAALLVMWSCILVRTFGLVNVLGVVYFICHKDQVEQATDWRSLFTYAVFAFLIPLIFFFQNYFLSGRYVLVLGLLSLFLVPFALQHAFQQWQQHAKKTWAIIFGVGLVYGLTASLFSFGPHASMVNKQAGQWIQAHIPKQASIISNSKQVLYYASESPDYRKHSKVLRPKVGQNPSWYLKQQEWPCYDYLVISGDQSFVPSSQHLLKNGSLLSMVKIVTGSHDKQVLIFTVNKQDC